MNRAAMQTPAARLEHARGPTVVSPPEGAPDRLRQDASAPIRCASCTAAVAEARDCVERFGAHTHDRMNPAGYTFRIRCFLRAAGVLEVGPESDEFPWFPKHVWRCVACAGCGAHLGWRFAGPSAETFLGLISDRLLDPS